MKRLLVAMIFCCFVVPAAQAGNFYVGGSVGSSSADLGQAASTRINFDATGYKLFAGYGAMRFLAFEVGYTDFGSPSESYGTATFDLDLKVGAVWAIGILPATPRLSLYGRLGYSAWNSELMANVPPDDPTTTDNDGNDIAYGFGIAYNITPSLGLQLEWENYELENAEEVTFASLGVRWTF